MPSNLLQIVQTVCDELGLNRPSQVVNSTDLQVRQLYALINRDLRELQQNYEWTALQTEFNLNVTGPISLIGNLAQGTNVITAVQALVGDYNNDFNTDYSLGNPQMVTGASGAGSFNNDFNNDFNTQGSGSTPLGPTPSQIVANPTLFLISGQGIPVNSRIIQADPNVITMSEYATVSAQNVILTASQDTYPGPSDFDRYINQTWWDRTNRWALIGPDSPQVDQWHRSGIVTIGPRRHFRQIGYNGLTTAGGALNNYRIWPSPGSNDTPIELVYEYISANCVLSAAGIPQPKFLADTDFPVLDENMIVLGAKWRMWQIKGFDYAPFQAEWQEYVDRKYAQDGGAKTLSMVGSRVGLYQSLIQDGNYPGTATSGQ